jgi:hypothetical protein
MCFHKWSKWQEYKDHYYWKPGWIFLQKYWNELYEATDIRQKRSCIKCGKMQDKLIRDGRL